MEQTTTRGTVCVDVIDRYKRFKKIMQARALLARLDKRQLRDHEKRMTFYMAKKAAG